MVDTVTSSVRPGLDALVTLVVNAETAGDSLLSTNRLIDALLDARPETSGEATDAIDAALTASAHRQIVPVDEAVEMVAKVTAS